MQKTENQIELSIHKPFGPRILEAQLPYPMIQSLNKVCDDIIKSKKKNLSLIGISTLIIRCIHPWGSRNESGNI